MFERMNGATEMFLCMIEIEANGNLQQQTIQAPRIVIENNFRSLLYEAAQAQFPVRVKMSRMVPIYNEFEHEWTKIENSITFTNNFYGCKEQEES